MCGRVARQIKTGIRVFFLWKRNECLSGPDGVTALVAPSDSASELLRNNIRAFGPQI
ncbi:hypothetical protein DENIS_1320 [Desulfonema ishimotonii]|uniref:Uncharacterized protein n=1 Tax=Desulfonema ishimotonii TaxID=45657 RepID=A0A401FTS7_9BACT|nr:hypothetical protein DENIS_1320 [Desulfonema ishimotonii]